MTRPARGDVWWLEEPDIGRRPALILTGDRAIDVLTWVLVAPATRTVRGIPTEVALDVEDGMPQPCALTLDNVRPASQALLTERLTTLDTTKMHQVCEALRIAVDCEMR